MKHPSEAFRSANLFDFGCGYLVVSRSKANGRVEAGFFLLDVFCLGVKDAGFHEFNSIADYQESLLDRLFRDQTPVRMTPAAARKLAEGAIGYARELGFSPGADYKKASRVFGGITTADCDEQFMFGKNGKPFYFQGPSDSPARAERILRVLEARCGKGGYHYIVAADGFEPFGAEEKNGESALTGPSQPGPAGQVNPPRRLKVSDMIWLVAEPLLESAPDYESKETILKLTVLAWNFTLLEPTEQEEMLIEIPKLFPCSDGVEMFFYLADRKALLFPEEDRVIRKVETGPASYSDVVVPVA